MEGPVDEYIVEAARFYLYTVGQFTTAARVIFSRWGRPITHVRCRGKLFFLLRL